ncbi:MAG: PAS domain-containing protein [Leptospiraceae bacterium]|nr:PAS domain-containing protein [Leptospiraceae bacterium]
MNTEEMTLSTFLVSRTDQKGRITYANDAFCKVSGYEPDELIGKPHNVVRHPDMPRETFKGLWADLKSGRLWSGMVKNRKKNGDHYWVKAWIYPYEDREGNSHFESVRVEMTDEMNRKENEKMNAILFDIIQHSIEIEDDTEFYDRAIRACFANPWLALEQKGGIFLKNSGENSLRLAHSINFSEMLHSMCAKVDFGQCLCGLAAQRRELVFADCVDDLHTTRPPGMKPHGHYNVPIILAGRLIGVIVFYISHGHIRNEFEELFLRNLANVMGAAIMRRDGDRQIKQLVSEISESNRKIAEQLQRNRNLHTIIQQYLPQTVWRQAGSAIEAGRVDLRGERKEMTYFFCDMSGFTAYSEIADPEDVISTVNQYFEAAVSIIHEEGGDIERFMGDGFLAIFEDAREAGRAALLCTRRFREIGAERAREGRKDMQFRIGLHSGVGVRGSVGGSLRKEFTVMGDAVNTASRLESLCSPGRILVSEDFYNKAPDRFLVGESFDIAMKGKAQPLKVRYLRGIGPSRPVHT